MRVSPLPTPSWGSALPGTLSPSSASAFNTAPKRHEAEADARTDDPKPHQEKTLSSTSGRATRPHPVPGCSGITPSHPPTHFSAKPMIKVGGSPLSSQVGDKSGCLASSTAEDPHTKQPRRRQRRHCSRVRWPRFPHLAPRPHPSKHGSESASTQPDSWTPNRRYPPIEPPTQR